MARSDGDSQAHLRLVGRILRKHWKLMLIVFLGVAVPVTAYNLLFQKKAYDAVASLYVDTSPEEYSFIRDWIPGSDIPLQLAVLKSRSLAEMVVESLPKESVDDLLKEGMYRDYLLELTNRFRKLRGKELVVLSPRERAVMELQNARTSFNVRGPQVEIRTIATRPKVAMDLANTYVEILLTRARSYVREEARAAREFLEKQLGQAQETLKEHEEQLSKSGRAGGWARPTQRAEMDLARLTQVETTLAEVQLNKEFAKSRLAALRAQGGEGAGAQRLSERRAQLEERLTALLERYTEQHPIVVATRAELQEIQKNSGTLPKEAQSSASRLSLAGVSPYKQVADLEQELATLQTKEEVLQQRVATARRSLTGMTPVELEQTRLLREGESQRNFVSLLMDKLTAARIREQGDVKSLRVIDLASLPVAPTGSRSNKKIAMGILLSLALSLGLGALLEFFKDPVETEDDICQTLGLPLLGYLPEVEPKEIENGAAANPLNLWEEPRPAVFAERCRSMAMLLEAMGKDRPLRTLLVTSAAPAEGKSTVTVNLAWACLEIGKQILVVDADLRRPALSRVFRLPEGPGLTELLIGDGHGDQVPVSVREGMRVLRSGAPHPVPQSLLTPKPAGRLLARVQEQADLVLFDSAPITAISDNVHLAALVDGVILVARAGETQKRELARLKAELEKFGARILGVVLNGLPRHAVKQYYGRYYAYYVSEAAPRNGWRRWLPWPLARKAEARRKVTRKRRDR